MNFKPKNIEFITALLGTDNNNNNNNDNNTSNTNTSTTPPSETPSSHPKLPTNQLEFVNNLSDLEQQFRQNNQITTVSNSTFKDGTYRIQQPGIYILKENIILEPNDGDNCFPKPSQNSKYPMHPGPYILGFFAGISIESDNVILDLNGFSIEQSIRFYLLQRFFSTIELANSPFIPKPDGKEGTQGPANFGNKFIAANNVIIRNGRLGLSSHHGIHGNSASNVLIENLKIEDFEVGGISLNGVTNVNIRNVVCQNSLGTNLKVPVNGRFSAAVYIWRTLKVIVDKNEPDYHMYIGKNKYYITDAVRQFDQLIRDTADLVVKNKLTTVVPFPKEIYNLFGNPDGFQDCSAIYGIVFNKKGIAVDEFGACDPVCTESSMSSNIVVENCSINNIVFKPTEVVALLNKDAKFQKDFSGSMIMVTNSPWFITEKGHENKFNPTATFIKNNRYDFILATQVLLYKYATSKNIKWAKGVADISDNIINWVSAGHKPLTYYAPIKTARNSDIMGHVMKGAVAIRLDFVKHGYLNNNKINKIINHSPPGIANYMLKGYIDSNISKQITHNNSYYHLGHPKSNDTNIGYTGNFVRGVSCISCNNVLVQSHKIKNLISDTGSTFGIDIINNNIDCNFNDNTIDDLQASVPTKAIPNHLEFNLPNWIPRAIGMIFRFNNNNCHAKNNKIKNIKSLIISNTLVIEASGDNIGATLGTQDKVGKQKYEIIPNIFDHRPAI